MTPTSSEMGSAANGTFAQTWLHFAKLELATAVARGVRQCVLLGSNDRLKDTLAVSRNDELRVFLLSEETVPDLPGIHVPASFASGTLAATLENSDFSRLKATLFVWLGAGYRTAEAAIASFRFIASLPEGSGVLFDYMVEQTPAAHFAAGALDGLASRLAPAGGAVRHLIQPPAVRALLKGIGFHQIVDVLPADLAATGCHLVSAAI
jgi:O-methyltransferase involved in polyketide biosynthesis